MPPRKKQAAAAAVAAAVAAVEAAQAAQAGENIVVQTPVAVAPTKPKRERKSTKHPVVAVVTPDGIQGTFQAEVKRPLIVHLPIHSKDVKFHDPVTNQDPTPPTAPIAQNAEFDNDVFSAEAGYENTNGKEGGSEDTKSVKEGGETATGLLHFDPNSGGEAEVGGPGGGVGGGGSATGSQSTGIASAPPQRRKEQGPTPLLAQFLHTKTTKQLPETTDVACFWCCEAFSGQPCVIPTAIQDSVQQVYGNFCCPQCAMAQLISELLDTHVRWERIALLNLLQGSSCGGRVQPAPNRETMRRFGGPLSKEEFIEICERQKIRVDVHMPPMVSILASMDTKPIDFYETSLRNTFATNLPQLTSAAEEGSAGLKLRRNKPLKDSHSTLDSCLQIQVKVR